MFSTKTAKFSLFKTTMRVLLNQTLRNHRYKRNNPGMDKRMSVLKSPQKEEEDFDMEELEADFMSIGKSHRQHEQEIDRLKEQVKLKIVQRKYFKQNLPGMLTWSDKEQIRFLHSKDPEEWTPEKLAEGFPASPDIIRLVLKANWQPKSKDRIRNHDRAVSENWKRFESGKAELPEDVREHAVKFSKRKKNLLSDKFRNDGGVHGEKTDLPAVQRLSTSNGPFSQIISSYYETKAKSEDPYLITDNAEARNRPIDKDTYIMDKTSISEHKYETLHNFQERLEEDSKSDLISLEDRLVLDKLSEENEGVAKKSVSEHFPALLDEKRVQLVTVEEKAVESYPEKILIPKKAYKKGSTYKVDDCYYDSDGSFLYRVPGMSN